ncbi:MAG: hypothetical protein ACYTFA_05605 [Planctomycetota bacterium]|jgi:hypothetical protein
MNVLTRTLTLGVVISAVLRASPGDDASGGQLETRLGTPPGTYTITPAADSIRIPFEVFQGDIRLIGRVNGKEVRMLIDNGGGLWDELLFFGSPKVDALGLKREGKIQVGGSGSGDPATADLAFGLSLSFDGNEGRTINFQRQPAIIMHYDPKKPNPWAAAEGQVSAAFFKHFVVGFDFDAGIMTLVRPEAFDPTGKGTEIPIKPVDTAGSGWTISGAITLHDGRRLEVDMTMDLGCGEPLAVNTGQAHNVDVPSGLKKTALAVGAQGMIYGYRGTVRRLEIGGFTLRDLTATYSTVEDGGGVDEILVGMGTFQRFHVIFDYPRHRLFVKPNRKFKEPFVTPETK